MAKRVVVADDNTVGRRVAEALLRALGCEVLAAANGREALAHVSAGGVDLVLMDIEMPELNGYDATRAIRALDSPAAATPVVALTAHGQSEWPACQAAGMNALLEKPLSLDGIRQTLYHLLGLPADAPTRGVAALAAVVTATHRKLAPLLRLESPPAGAAMAGGGLPQGASPAAVSQAMAVGAAATDPVLDDAVIERLRRLSTGSRNSLLERLLRLFLDGLPRHLDNLRDAIARKDAAAIAHVAHTLRGSCLTVGATQTAAMLRLLEQAGRSGDLSQVAAQQQALLAACDRLKPLLAAHLPPAG